MTRRRTTTTPTSIPIGHAREDAPRRPGRPRKRPIEPVVSTNGARPLPTLDARELVKRARGVERLVQRRGRLLRDLRDLDREIRTEKKLLGQLTERDALAPYVPADNDAPIGARD